MTKSDLFTTFFRELERREIPYVVLHSYQKFPHHFDSDIDYAVADNRRREIPKIEHEVARQCGWLVVQRLEHESCAFSSVLVDRDNPEESLMLDVTSHYLRNSCWFLSDTDLLHDRRRFRNFFVPSPSSEFIYTWVKLLAKHKSHEPYVHQLRKLFDQEPDRSQTLFARVFGSDAGEVTDWFTRSSQEWRSLGDKLHRRNRFTVAQRAREWQRIAARILRPTGFAIALLGPDGAGKSTVVSNFTACLRLCFRRTLLIHFLPRPGANAAGAVVTVPHNQPPRATSICWAKILYYFVCHWMHHLTQQWPARIRATLIVFDRNFDDLLVDPRRYRIKNSAWLVGMLRRFLPQPDLVIILDAPAEVIHARKSELTPAEIERQRGELIELAKRNSRAAIIDASGSAEEVSKRTCLAILNRLALRQERSGDS